MESGGKGEDGVFDVFREAGFVELLGEGGLGGTGELLDMGDEGMEQKLIRVAEGEHVGVANEFFLRCPSAYPLPSSSSPTSSSYRMLCFGGDEGFPTEGSNKVHQKSIASGNDSFHQKSSASGNDSYSSTSSSSSNSSLSKLKKNTLQGRGCSAAADRGRTSTDATKGTAATKAATNATKKPRREQPHQRHAAQGRTLKVRKENLGERITALQQLVSPFGKSDTASVLHEALDYIKFLHSQVQVLSSPYMQRLPLSAQANGGSEGESRHDLRSRGLCLVPVACTAQMAGSNGADFWSPAMGSSVVDCQYPEVTDH